MTTKVKLALNDLSKVDPRDAWCALPSGAPKLVSQLLAVAIGMDEDEAATAKIPIWDQEELKKRLRQEVLKKFKTKAKREVMTMAQFSILVALNVGSRELLKALVSNLNEDYGEVIKEISVYRESNVGRA